METAPLKSFATSARTELIREVAARITAVLAQGSPERVEQPKAVTALERAIAGAGGGDKGKAHVADKVAYTWFNRIIALRFMDANGYTGIGVVSPAADQVGQPEVLAAAKRGQIDKDVVKGTNPATITGLLNGTRQPRPGVDAQAEAYALLLADYCRFWNTAMPFMFEREGDYTELLIPANLLADDSVLSRSVTVLTEDVCQDVEVIGWLYQFYISERKDEVFAGFKKNKKAGADEIPAATQLFTPHWIVRYLVENSLGRLWMLNRPSSGLASQMDYYIAPVDEETDFLKIGKPEELKVIDPACGSGHMLTYAFDLLYAIYEEEGYAPSEIPGLILANNLYGTEIDPRAGALAAFALTMKASGQAQALPQEPGRAEHLRARPDLIQRRRAELSRDQGWGSLRRGGVLESVCRGRHVWIADRPRSGLTCVASRDISRRSTTTATSTEPTRSSGLARLVASRATCRRDTPWWLRTRRTWVLATWSATSSTFVKDLYPLGKSDLFSAFMLRGFGLLAPRGYSAMVVMQSWMFLAAYEKFRHEILRSRHIECLAHLGNGVMGIAFGTSAVVIQADKSTDTRGAYLKYSTEDIVNGVPRPLPSEAAPKRRASRDFSQVPGYPLVYFATDDELSVLAKGPRVGDLLETREGLTTETTTPSCGDGSRCLRGRWGGGKHLDRISSALLDGSST